MRLLLRQVSYPILRQSSYSALAVVVTVCATTAGAAAQLRYESLAWSADGTELSVAAAVDGAADIYALPLGEGPARRLTSDPARDAFASWSPGGGAFAFASARAGHSAIYVADADGGDVRRLTDGASEASWPAWSPDGERIAFMSKRSGRWQIWVMAADGSDVERVTSSGGNDYNPRWSPDGRHLVFESDRNGGDQDDIYVIGADGSGERRVTATPGNDVYPDWSPRGERIVFCTIEAGRASIRVVPVEGGEATVVVRDACRPVWSPDGSRLAYQTARRGEAARLVIADADGRHPREIPGLDEREIRGPAAMTPGRRPRVAILIYDGVQIIDHAAPWEVLGQYGLNDVFTVAKDTLPVTTFMGMRVLPSHSFGDHPVPDVVVVPGGDAGAARRDTAVIGWIRRNAAESRYVLGICSGVMILGEAGLLEGRRATTFYDLLDDLARTHPDVRVVEDELVVEDGSLITTTGTGIQGSLRVLERLHGAPWARIVALNMELEPLPDATPTPRAWLADMNLPSAVYGVFPWREAELVRYGGDTESWTMAWRFMSPDPLASLAERVEASLMEEGWRPVAQDSAARAGTTVWRLQGRDGAAWRGRVSLAEAPGGVVELVVSVESLEGA